jgi:hypothetical protein
MVKALKLFPRRPKIHAVIDISVMFTGGKRKESVEITEF